VEVAETVRDTQELSPKTRVRSLMSFSNKGNYQSQPRCAGMQFHILRYVAVFRPVVNEFRLRQLRSQPPKGVDVWVDEPLPDCHPFQ